jgi:electron transport complex protein RnfA
VAGEAPEERSSDAGRGRPELGSDRGVWWRNDRERIVMSELTWIFLSAMVVNNFTLALFLGLCPFMGVSARVETALRMGVANIFVLVLTSLTVSFLNAFILERAPYLRIISFIVVIASLVQIVETVIKKVSPKLFQELGIYLPLITTNCAILGLAIFQTNRDYDVLEGLAFAIGAGFGLTLALILMASIREETELADVPSIARGMGLVLIIAGSLSMGFMGFAGLLSSS